MEALHGDGYVMKNPSLLLISTKNFSSYRIKGRWGRCTSIGYEVGVSCFRSKSMDSLSIYILYKPMKLVHSRRWKLYTLLQIGKKKTHILIRCALTFLFKSRFSIYLLPHSPLSLVMAKTLWTTPFLPPSLLSILPFTIYWNPTLLTNPQKPIILFLKT